MTKHEKIMEVWTKLKEKITNPWKEGKVIVYRDFVAPQPVPGSQALSIAESDQYQLGLLLRDLGYTSLAPLIDIQELRKAINSFTGDKQKYEKQLITRLQEYTRLETKLEKIRNLIADNQLEKLKRMMKKGEI